MTTLAACPSCSRHVRIDEVRCPFCAAGLEGAFAHRPSPRRVAGVGRLSRAALLAMGTSAAAAGTIIGCSSSDDTHTTSSSGGASSGAIYGAPPVDSGSDAGDTGSSAALYGLAPQDAGGNAALYGKPPNSDF